MSTCGFQGGSSDEFLAEKHKHVENPIPGMLEKILKARRTSRENEKKEENDEQGS